MFWLNDWLFYNAANDQRLCEGWELEFLSLAWP